MSRCSAQISLYPLRRAPLGPEIDRALAILRRRNLGVEPGRMSTVATGPAEELFAALHEVFEEASEKGDVVMVLTLSNACPSRCGLRSGEQIEALRPRSDPEQDQERHPRKPRPPGQRLGSPGRARGACRE